MIAFEVWLNEEKLCLAGIGEYGVLAQHLDWVKSEPKANSNKKSEPIKPRFAIGGLVNREHVDWISHRDIEIGDEVTIKILDVESADEPVLRQRSKSSEERAQKVRDGLAATRALLPSPLIEGDFLASLRGIDELLALNEQKLSVKVLANLGDLNACEPKFWRALSAVASDLQMYRQCEDYDKKAGMEDD